MSDLKPLGSEKLNGDEKLKRILELAYWNTNKKSNDSKAELVSESKNGGVYGIVREKDGYYVKQGLNESSLDYIGGMYMKNKNRFNSYSEAFKRLEYIKGQTELQEATKYVLKQKDPSSSIPPPPATEAPSSEPSMDTPPPPTPDASGDESTDSPENVNTGSPLGDDSTPVPTDTENTDMGDDSKKPSENDEKDTDNDEESEPKRSDYMSEIHKYSGKLGQELRDQGEKLDAGDIKYVLNMIISALDLKKLSSDDLDEISDKFNNAKSSDNDDDNESNSDENEPNLDNTESIPSPEEMGEEAMVKLDNFINTPIQTNENYDDDFGDEEEMKSDRDADMDIEKNQLDKHEPRHFNQPKHRKFNKPEKHSGFEELGKYDDLGHLGEEDDIMEIDLDEIKNAIGQTLSKYFK